MQDTKRKQYNNGVKRKPRTYSPVTIHQTSTKFVPSPEYLAIVESMGKKGKVIEREWTEEAWQAKFEADEATS